ncbi:TPA: metallophosphoesterase family protein [Streptococcus suis]|nr:metallophosphoesterase family protein [Streptococcus suis]
MLKYTGVNKPFTILQFTDIHLGQMPFNQEDRLTLQKIEETLESSSPDLICITGDLIWTDGVNKPQDSLQALADILNKFPIPVAITYGNHDSEQTLTRQSLQQLEKKFFKRIASKTNCFIDSNHKECFTLEVFQENDLEHVLYFIDSGADALIDYESYDWVSLEQIEWYKRTADQYLSKYNLHNDLLFLHIPLPEFVQAGDHVIDGYFWESNPRISCPKLNTGLFSQILYRHHISAIACGHDHDNNFVGEYLQHKFIFGNVTGYNCYGNLPRGYRIIELLPNSMNTHIVRFS